MQSTTNTIAVSTVPRAPVGVNMPQDSYINESLAVRATKAIPVVKPFLSCAQMAVMSDCCRGEEKAFFQQKFVDMAFVIENMAKTYEQDGKGDQALVYLHYFIGCFDWYITEKDMEDGISQAFGYTIVGPHERGELGYISIEEITRCGAELDLHFTPCTLAEIKAKRAA